MRTFDEGVRKLVLAAIKRIVNALKPRKMHEGLRAGRSYSQTWKDCGLPQILIVDDDHQLRLLLARNFTRSGYEVAVAATAIEATELCGDRAFDAVLSDVEMPGMDGHELARWIARNHPHVLCILMSGVSAECKECPSFGGCMLLRKPFAPKAAVDLITKMLIDRLN